MFLYYDRMAEMFSLQTEDDVEFLGPWGQTLLTLQKKHELTSSQAVGAMVQARTSAGILVDIDNLIRKIY